MCGINGVISFKHQLDKSSLGDMSRMTIHRGPDSSNEIILNNNIYLQHNRLAIIDLNKRSEQPFFSQDKDYCIVFNGEIYNFIELRKDLLELGYSFRTSSDTEVLLYLFIHFGHEILDKIKGFYSFVIIDLKKKQGYLFRDKSGIKPLFFYHHNDYFIFSSELKSILSNKFINKEIDYQAIKNYFSLGYIPSPRTPFTQIRQVEPGEIIILNLSNNSKKHLKKSYNKIIENKNFDQEHIKSTISNSIISSTVSDVDIGLLLSSGLDSNILLYELLENGINVNPISIGFKSYEEFDETKTIKKIYDFYGLKENIIEISDFDFPSLLNKTVYHQDYLNSNLANMAVYSIFEKAKLYNKVFLTGSGLDELYGGYMTYKASYLNGILKRLKIPINKIFNSKLLQKIFGNPGKYSYGYLIYKFLEGSKYDSVKSHIMWRSFWDDQEIDLLLKDNNELIQTFDDLNSNNEMELEHYNYLMSLDYKFFLNDNANQMIDSLSMAHSVESRPSFLSDEIISMAFSTNYKNKFDLRNNKKILRKIYKDKIPQFVLNNSKKGLVLPLQDILKNQLKNETLSLLESKSLKKMNIKIPTSKINNFLNGKNDIDVYKVYNLLTLSKWCDYFLE